MSGAAGRIYVNADGRPEQPLHLTAQPLRLAVLAAAAAWGKAHVEHEIRQAGAKVETALPCLLSLRRHPEQQQPRQRPIGNPERLPRIRIRARLDRQDEVAVAPLPDRDVAGVAVRQGALHEEPGAVSSRKSSSMHPAFLR